MSKFRKGRPIAQGSAPRSPVRETDATPRAQNDSHAAALPPDADALDLDELLELGRGQAERLTAIERMMRYAANESMSLSGSNEALTGAVAAVSRQLIDLELVIKGILTTVSRREEENQQVLQGFRRHFSEQIAQLEARIDAEVQARAVDRVARRVLPAVDDLDLILSEPHQIRQSLSVTAWLEATEVVRRKLLHGLTALGLEVQPIVEGETLFDANVHEAVPADSHTARETLAGVPDFTVLSVKRNGYLLGGDLYRPARVVVKLKDPT